MPTTSWNTANAPATSWGTQNALADYAVSVTTSVTTSYVTTVYDAFTGTSGSNLTTHEADSGASWTQDASLNDALVLSGANRVYTPGGSVTAQYVTGAVPPGSDYTVSAVIRALSAITDSYAGIIGRVNAAGNSLYYGRYAGSAGAGTARWELYKVVAGSATLLGSANHNISTSSDYVMRLVLAGTSIRLLVNDASQVSVTDGDVTAAGTAGFRCIAPVAQTDTTGLHLDEFTLRGWLGVTTSSVSTAYSWGTQGAPTTSWVTVA